MLALALSLQMSDQEYFSVLRQTENKINDRAASAVGCVKCCGVSMWLGLGFLIIALALLGVGVNQGNSQYSSYNGGMYQPNPCMLGTSVSCMGGYLVAIYGPLGVLGVLMFFGSLIAFSCYSRGAASAAQRAMTSIQNEVAATIFQQFAPRGVYISVRA
jgi:hypothetical protein